MQICEFQEMMRQLYYHRDFKRGIEGTLEWLTDEVEELREALENGDKKGTEEEFADVLAWLASLANIAGVDLEKAALEKYPKMCPKCKHTPCECTF